MWCSILILMICRRLARERVGAGTRGPRPVPRVSET